jgi:hypothetical protein
MSARSNTRKFKSAKALIKPFFGEIGEAVYRWNELHENLALLFSKIVQPKQSYPRVAHAIWYELNNDRMQRQTLKSAAFARFGKIGVPQHDEIRAEIKWLISEVDSLADKRNDLVHAPLAVSSQYQIQLDASWRLTDRVVQPADWYGHTRAKKLKEKGFTGSELKARFRSTSLYKNSNDLTVAARGMG